MGTHSEIQMENPQARQSATPSPVPGLKLSLTPPPSGPAQLAVLENADLREWLGAEGDMSSYTNHSAPPLSCRLPPPPPDLHSQLSQSCFGLPHKHYLTLTADSRSKFSHRGLSSHMCLNAPILLSHIGAATHTH